MIHKQAGLGRAGTGGWPESNGRAEDMQITTSITSTTSILETLKTEEARQTHHNDVAQGTVNKGHQT